MISSETGIKVKRALRLDLCVRSLGKLISKRGPARGDENMWLFHPKSWPKRRDWVNRVNSQNIAEIYLLRAIASRRLRLWVRTPQSEEQIDPPAIRSLTSRSIIAGTYLDKSDDAQEVYSRTLWVKRTDWHGFLGPIIAQRYGRPLLRGRTRLKERAASPKRRGRPIGSGSYRVADELIYKKMQILIDDGVATSADDAARILAPEGPGRGTLQSTKSRLARGFRASRNSENK